MLFSPIIRYHLQKESHLKAIPQEKTSLNIDFPKLDQTSLHVIHKPLLVLHIKKKQH